MELIVHEHHSVLCTLKKLFKHDVSRTFEGTAPFAETLCDLGMQSETKRKRKKETTDTIEHHVACGHSVGHIHVNGIPNGLQNLNGGAVGYDPGIGLHPNPPLVCGDENQTESIVHVGSSRERGGLLLSCFICGHIYRSQCQFAFTFQGRLGLAQSPLVKIRSDESNNLRSCSARS